MSEVNKIFKNSCKPVSWQAVCLDILLVDEWKGMAESSVEQVERLIALDTRVKHGPVGTPEKQIGLSSKYVSEFIVSSFHPQILT